MPTPLRTHILGKVTTDPRCASYPATVQASAAAARVAADAVPPVAAAADQAASDTSTHAGAAGTSAGLAGTASSVAAGHAAAATDDAARALAAADAVEEELSPAVVQSLRLLPPLDYVALDTVAEPAAPLRFGFQEIDIDNAGTGEIHLLLRPRGASTALFGGFSSSWYIGSLPSGQLGITEASGVTRPLGVSLTPGVWQWVSVSLGTAVRAIVGDTVGPTVTPSASLDLGRLFGASPAVASAPRFIGDVALIAFTSSAGGPRTLAVRNSFLSGRYPGRLPLVFRPSGLRAGVWREQGDSRLYLAGLTNITAASTSGPSRRHACSGLFPSIAGL